MVFSSNLLVYHADIYPPVMVYWHTAVMPPERCCPKPLLQLHSEAAVLVDTALEEDQHVAASVAKMADSLLSYTYT